MYDAHTALARLVTTREEERRRLRRDLHDGLGPALAGMGLQLETAEALTTSDPEGARALLRKLRDETQSAIVDIRRLVRELRPPALDQLGLVGALREHAVRMCGCAVTVDAPAQLPPLAAAVEVAAYRIAVEALASVAHARRCTVTLRLNGGLELSVIDDGDGMPANLTSMRERADELGGTCVAEPLPAGGTAVRARLPLEAP